MAATPAVQGEVARACIEKRVHVFVEKPLATTAADAARVAAKAGETVNVSDKSGRYLCEIGKAVPVKDPKRETADKGPDENTSKNPKAGK